MLFAELVAAFNWDQWGQSVMIGAVAGVAVGVVFLVTRAMRRKSD